MTPHPTTTRSAATRNTKTGHTTLSDAARERGTCQEGQTEHQLRDDVLVTLDDPVSNPRVSPPDGPQAPHPTGKQEERN